MADPVCLADFEDYARKHLPKHAFEFFAGGANDEHTLRENLEAFKRYDYKTLETRNYFSEGSKLWLACLIFFFRN